MADRMFGLIAAGRQPDFFKQVGDTEFLCELQAAETVNHLVVFMTGMEAFPEGLGASVYVCWQMSGETSSWNYLGAISNGKPSAIFKISQIVHAEGKSSTLFGGNAYTDTHGTAQVGIKIEPLNIIESLEAGSSSKATSQSTLAEFADKLVHNLVNYSQSYTVRLPKHDGVGFADYIPINALQEWMYSLIHETDDSTTVNFSVYGKFIPGTTRGNQLITIGGKYMRIFRTNPYAMVPLDEDSEEWEQKTKLECIFSFRLLSNPVSIAQANIPLYPDAECLLMAFEEAKLSIVAVDNRTRSLKTISLHSYDDEYLRGGNTKNFPAPLIRVDPLSRCAAMLVYGKHLAILPFTENQQQIKSFVVSLKQIDARLDNVVDMTFLEGYYEPTILFLYEPLQTTAGRASIRYDTMAIMGVSLNTIDKQTAVVWQIGNLPMDGYLLCPIPKPIGGAVVIGVNDIIYINQAVPPCGIVLNSCYDNFTKFPLKDLKSLAITLESACAEYISHHNTSGKIFLGTSNGKLMLLSLHTDSSNSVKSLSLTELSEISTPYCLKQCAPGHLFVGSRLGDSQLLQFIASSSEQNGQSEEKRQKKTDYHMDDEDLELYGDAEDTEVEYNVEPGEVKWTITELDKLLNIAPIKCLTTGIAQDVIHLLHDKKKSDPFFEMVGACGHGKEGALCILHRTVRPDVLTSSVLDGARHMWAVGQHENGNHKYLIVSRQRSTLVLEVGDDMIELEDPLFITCESTVAAGELADGALVVQVTSMNLCLVADDRKLQEIQLNTNFPVVAASIVDPYVALLTQHGKLILFEIAISPEELNLKSLENSVGLTSASVYKDLSGLLTYASRRDAYAEYNRRGDDPKDDADIYSGAADDEDLLLYGSTQKEKRQLGGYDQSRKRKRGAVAIATTGGEESDAVNPNEMAPIYFLLSARETGKLIIYSLPDMKIVFQIKKFSAMNELYFDTTDDEEKDRKESENPRRPKDAGESHEVNDTIRQEEKIVELQIAGMGIGQGRPVMFAIIDDLVLAYEIFSHPNTQPEHLAIALKRMQFTHCIRSDNYMGADGRRKEVQFGQDNDRHRKIIHQFERIGKVQNGIFITGTYPCMVLHSAWGGLQFHPLIIDGPIRTFTPINNDAIQSGFLYVTEDKSELRISKLPKGISYDLPIPCKKIEVKSTIHFVRYMMQSQVYAVVSSVQKPTSKIWVVVNDDKQEETHPKPQDFVLPTIHHFSLNLYSSDNWTPIPGTEFELQELEHVTACEEVSLRSEATMSGLQNYLALGTINNYGEEHLVRGRIILAEIIDVVPDPSQPRSKHKLKILYESEQKSPVTSICSLNGFLLTGMGQKIFIWGFKDNDLQGISFLDMHYYVHSLVGFRNMALACDMQTSLSLVRFQEQFKALSIASRDDRLSMISPMQAQYLVDNEHIGFVMSDEQGNILMFNYSPEIKESVGGEKLILRGGINVGTNVNVLLRIKGHTSLSSNSDPKTLAQQQTTFWASLDGSFGYVRPISEKSFRRLSFLHQVMSSGVPHSAGLNPKGARSIHPQMLVINSANHKNMVDGDIVFDFMHLSTSEKQDMARRLGASRYHIMDDLVQIQRLAIFY